jgi:hypothetical protein
VYSMATVRKTTRTGQTYLRWSTDTMGGAYRVLNGKSAKTTRTGQTYLRWSTDTMGGAYRVLNGNSAKNDAHK